MQPDRGPPQPGDEELDVAACKVADGEDAHPSQGITGLLPDTRDLSYRQGVEERRDLIWADDRQPVRLPVVGCDLCCDFAWRDTDGAGEPLRLPDIPLDRCGEHSSRQKAPGAGDIEVGLIDAHLLDAVGISAEDRHDLPRYLGVERVVHREVDGVRTEGVRPGDGHARVHTVTARLVGTGAHNSASNPSLRVGTHDHRHAVEGGITVDLY